MRRTPRPDPNPTKEMPFTHHLEELRWHLLRAIFYVFVIACGVWEYYKPIFNVIARPIVHAYQAAGFPVHMTFFDVLEPLFFKLQIVITVAIIFGLPLLIWEVYRFVAPGLYANERRYVGPLLPFSIVLALLGVTLVYYALPLAFQFLLGFAPHGGDADNVQMMQHLPKYFMFLLQMMIGAAVAFQTPVVLTVLGQLGLVTARGLLHFWRHAVLICFVVAAVITPTIDPFNMSVIALPLCSLYFLSVTLVWFVERGRAKRARLEAAAQGGATSPDAPAPPSDPTPPPTPPATEPGAPGPIDQPPAGDPSGVAALAPSDPEPSAPAVVDRSILGPLADPQAEIPPEAEPETAYAPVYDEPNDTVAAPWEPAGYEQARAVDPEGGSYDEPEPQPPTPQANAAEADEALFNPDPDGE